MAQLAELLENLQIQLTQGGGGGSGGEPSEDEMSEELRESLEDLAELMGEQRELQDETDQAQRDEIQRRFDEAMGRNQGESDGQGDGGESEGQTSLSPEALAQRQAEITELLDGLGQAGDEDGDNRASGDRDAPDGEAGGLSEDNGTSGGGSNGLDDLLERLRSGGDDGDPDAADSIENGLAEAEAAMERSETALREGDLSGSRAAQTEAIAALRDAGEALSNAVLAGTEDGEGEGDDPLGRDANGFGSDNAEADIETKDNATRSREILEELRRRAAEAEREQQEKDYLDRLLDRY